MKNVFFTRNLVVALGVYFVFVSSARADVNRIFSFNVANTASATQNSALLDLGSVPGGTTVRVGTCSAGDNGLGSANAVGDTFLRVFSRGVEFGFDDDTCGLASYLTFTVPFSSPVSVQVGCFENLSCSGTLQVTFSTPDSNGSLSDVVSAFNSIVANAPSAANNQLNVSQNGLVGSGYTTSTLSPNVKKHFQGIQRIGPLITGQTTEGNFLFSGSEGGDLWSAQFAPTSSLGPVAPQPQSPNSLTRLTNIVRVPFGTEGHLGGLQASGGFLAGGVEPSSTRSESVLHFWNVVFPSGPFPARGDLFLSDSQSCCVGLTKMPGVNQPFLMAVGGAGTRIVKMFVLSNAAKRFGNMTSDQWEQRGTLALPTSGWEEYQSLNFVNQDDGRLFLVGTLGRNKTTGRVESGEDVAVLYEITHRPPVPNSRNQPTVDSFFDFVATKVTEKTFTCAFNFVSPIMLARQCAFNGMAGIFVNPDLNKLTVYSGKAFRPSSTTSPLTFVEFN